MSDQTSPMSIPSWMIFGAFRGICGFESQPIAEMCDWLVAHWGEIPEGARSSIRLKLEMHFADDDRLRASKNWYTPLGSDSDRKHWERVRALWGEGRERPEPSR